MATPKKQDTSDAARSATATPRRAQTPSEVHPHRVLYNDVDVNSYDTRTAKEIEEARKAEEEAEDE